MLYKSQKFLALAALLALASENAYAFTPSTLSNQRFAHSKFSVAAVGGDVDVSIDYDSAAKLAYDQWRSQNGKGDYDDAKFEAFKANYVALTVANVKAAKKARDEGSELAQKLELNEYADMTVAEFQAMQGGGSTEEPAAVEEPAPVEDADVSIVYDSAARLAYDEWRAKFNQGEFVETKYQVFKENYEIVAVANVAAKKAARDSGSEAAIIELGEDADSAAVVIETAASVDPLKTAMDAMAAQEVASDAIGEAAAAIAEEEKVNLSMIIGTCSQIISVRYTDIISNFFFSIHRNLQRSLVWKVLKSLKQLLTQEMELQTMVENWTPLTFPVRLV